MNDVPYGARKMQLHRSCITADIKYVNGHLQKVSGLFMGRIPTVRIWMECILARLPVWARVAEGKWSCRVSGSENRVVSDKIVNNRVGNKINKIFGSNGIGNRNSNRVSNNGINSERLSTKSQQQ